MNPSTNFLFSWKILFSLFSVTVLAVEAQSLEIIPRSPVYTINTAFTLRCTSSSQGRLFGYPKFYFKDKISVSTDRRFRETVVGYGIVELTVDRGLTLRDNYIRIYCRDDYSHESRVIIKITCPENHQACDSNDACIENKRFCDKVLDCRDGSDEKHQYCNPCNPIAKKCKFHNNKAPIRKDIEIRMICDGYDDCGNGYDESECNDQIYTRCGGMKFQCTSDWKKIPRAFLCDGINDCYGGEDERNCRHPRFVRKNPKIITENGGRTITLTCRASGYPLPRVVWTFNGVCLPDRNNFRVSTHLSNDCTETVSTLRIENYAMLDWGQYHCDARDEKSGDVSDNYFVGPSFSPYTRWSD